MKIITANLLNRFWKNGIKPIKEKVDKALPLSGGVMNNNAEIIFKKDYADTTIDGSGIEMDDKEAGSALKLNGYGGVVSKREPLELTTEYSDRRVCASLNYPNNNNNAYFIAYFGKNNERQSSADLGSSTSRWNNIYAANGVIQTSDRTKKTDITELSEDLAKAIVMGLLPSSYKMTEGTSGRTHYGLIAQDVEKLMLELGMDSKDFAGFIKSPKVIRKETDEDGNPLKEPIEEVVEGEYDYALRYDEFIAPIIKVVQNQQMEIEELKEELRILKSI